MANIPPRSPKSEAAHPPTGWAACLAGASTARLVAVVAVEVAVVIAVRHVVVAIEAVGLRDARLRADLGADLRVGRGGRDGAGEADREGDRGGEGGEGLHGGWSCPFGLIHRGFVFVASSDADYAQTRPAPQ